MTTELILEAIRTSFNKQKRVTVNLREKTAEKINEASALTGSGAGVGGRVIYDDAFASLRYANPIRAAGARVIKTIGSDEAFVVKQGNVTNPTNPWGYAFTPDVGTPNTSTSFWQIQIKSIAAQVPVRTAILGDVNNLDATLIKDIGLEFSTQEAQSMMLNNDNSGSTTTSTGGIYGLRGLNYYAGSTSAASFGTSGSGLSNGRHTMLNVASGAGGAIAYNDMVALAQALPPQYHILPSTAWMMHPNTVAALRDLKDSGGLPLFLEIGQKDGFSIGNIFGHPVIQNPFMDQIGSGNNPVYLAAWERFVTIADHEEMSFQWMEQTAPGFMTLFAEKRMASTILDVFAGVRLTT